MLSTERLQLIPLDVKALGKLKHSLQALEAHLHLAPSELRLESEHLLRLNEAISFWLLNVAKNPGLYQWYTTWLIILKEKNCAVGGIGFAGPPDLDGQVFFGYFLGMDHRKKGIMSEAFTAIKQWAFSHEDVEMIMTEIPKDNLPAQMVLQKNNFILYEETSNSVFYQLHRGVG